MTSKELGDWLTATRVERLPRIIRAVRNHPPPGIAIERASRVIWPQCGGPMYEVEEMLRVLERARLITSNNGRVRLSAEGRRVATQDRQAGGTLLARALIDAGFFLQQARRLGELWTMETKTGDFTCPRKVAIATAPQLIGLLRLFPGVKVQSVLYVPAKVAKILADVWALPTQDEYLHRTVGARGEYYSYRYEQMRASDAAKIHWVALDDSTLGYDIEDLNAGPRRRIEVKASGGKEMRFVLSSNEWKVAHGDPLVYEVQYWGNVNTSRPMRDEFDSLVSEGYPVILQNVAGLIAAGNLVAEPDGYVVTEPTAS